MITVPSDEILMKYASGVLDPALHLLVGHHLTLHPATRARLAEWEAMGGALLAAEPGIALTAGSLDRVLARLGDTPQSGVTAANFPALDTLRWRWAGPGRYIANIEIAGSRLKTYAFWIAPGKAMLNHSHTGKEWTLIIQGSYRDEHGEYSAHAFIEEDEETNHRPVVTGVTDCICLTVMSGPLNAPGLTGKAARWLMG